MEKLIFKIQRNKTINAFNAGAHRVSDITIVMGFVIIFAQFFPHVELVGLYQISLGILGFIMSYTMAKRLLKHKDASIQLAVSFVSLLSLISFKNHLDLLPTYPVVAGLITLLLSRVVKKIDVRFFKRKDSIPHAVSDYLNHLLNLILIFLIGGCIIFGFDVLFLGFMKIYLIILKLASSLIVVMLTIIFICYVWYLGMHGATVISSILRPVYLQMMLFNIYCFILKEPILYIGTDTFLQWAVWLGGSGATLGLSLSLRFFAQSKTLKDLGKTSLNQGIYNINETVIFGVPIAENKLFKIPFFITPLILSVCAYSAIYYELVGKFVLVMPWILPIPIGALLSSMSLRVMLFSLLLIFISWLIYYPFFRKYDQMLLKEEQLENKQLLH